MPWYKTLLFNSLIFANISSWVISVEYVIVSEWRPRLANFFVYCEHTLGKQGPPDEDSGEPGIIDWDLSASIRFLSASYTALLDLFSG